MGSADCLTTGKIWAVTVDSSGWSHRRCLEDASLAGNANESDRMHLAAAWLLFILPAASSRGAGNPFQNTAFAPPALGTLPWTRAALRGRATSPAVPQLGNRAESWKGLRVVLAKQPGWEGYVDRSNQV